MNPIDFWYLRNIPGKPQIRSVDFGNGLFVAVGDGIYTSPDGIDWTNRYLNPPEPVFDVVYTDNHFVAISQVELPNQTIPGSKVLLPLLSTDGQSWVPGTTNSTIFHTSAVASINDVVVAAGNEIQTSQFGGEKWQITSQPDTNSFFLDICAGKSFLETNIFVAVGLYMGEGLSQTRICAVSTNGLSWNQNITGIDTFFKSVAYGNGYFVAAGSNRYFYTSSDGLHWTRRAYLANDDLTKITYGNNMFVAVGAGGYVYDSLDGDKWNSRIIGGGENLIEIHFGAETFIAVANNGNIYQSESYSADRHLLSIEFSGIGKVEINNPPKPPITCRYSWGGTFPAGQQVTLTASGVREQVINWVTDPFGHRIPLPTNIWIRTHFERWTSPLGAPGAVNTNNPEITVTMDSDQYLIANFEIRPQIPKPKPK